MRIGLERNRTIVTAALIHRLATGRARRHDKGRLRLQRRTASTTYLRLRIAVCLAALR